MKFVDQYITGATLNRVLVEIAVLVAEDLAVGQQDVLELDVIDGSLDRHLQGIDLLGDADAAARGRNQRNPGEAAGESRGAGIVAIEHEVALAIQRGGVGKVIAAIEPGIDGRMAQSL